MKIFQSGTTAALRASAALIILTSVALLAYANTFNTPFIYDDTNNILTHTNIRMTRITPEAMLSVCKGQFGNRPLANLTMAFNYYFHRYDVRGYHAVNLFIHLCTALLVFLVARPTLRLCGMETIMTPILAAALWLVNPVHTQSVTYTVQRMNSLAAMFYMLALFCYIQARISATAGQGFTRRLLLYGLCLISGIFALASKEIAATLPVMIFLYEWYFFRDLDRVWLKKKLSWIGLSVLAFLALAVLYPRILETYKGQDFTPAQRLLTEPAVIIYYISLLLFPYPGRLALIYDFPAFTSIFDPLASLAGILGIFALIIGGIMLAGKQRLLSFAIFWFLGNLIIESSVFGLALIFEHRTYLPSVFPFVALTSLSMKPPKTRGISFVILCVLIAVCGVQTRQRNTVWQNAIRFWSDNAAKAPNDTTVHNNLGESLLVAGKTEQAAAHLNRAIAIAPECEHYNNLGLATMKNGEMKRAIDLFHQALRHSPHDANTHFNLGTAYFRKNDLKSARHHLQQAVRFSPNPVLALNNLAAILIIQKDYAAATEALTSLAGLMPESPSVHYNLACVYALRNKKKEALTHLKKAVETGYDRWNYMKTDPDLKNIRDTGDFKSLVNR